jgi:hypothetical protein
MWWKKKKRPKSDAEISEAFDMLAADSPQAHFKASDETWQAVMRQKFAGLAPGERAMIPQSIDGCRVWLDGSIAFGDFVIDN